MRSHVKYITQKLNLQQKTGQEVERHFRFSFILINLLVFGFRPR